MRGSHPEAREQAARTDHDTNGNQAGAETSEKSKQTVHAANLWQARGGTEVDPWVEESLLFDSLHEPGSMQYTGRIRFPRLET